MFRRFRATGRRGTARDPVQLVSESDEQLVLSLGAEAYSGARSTRGVWSRALAKCCQSDYGTLTPRNSPIVAAATGKAQTSSLASIKPAAIRRVRQERDPDADSTAICGRNRSGTQIVAQARGSSRETPIPITIRLSEGWPAARHRNTRRRRERELPGRGRNDLTDQARVPTDHAQNELVSAEPLYQLMKVDRLSTRPKPGECLGCEEDPSG